MFQWVYYTSGVFKWCPKKSYFQIKKGTKNVRNPHILRTLPILHFFELFKKIWNFIWFVYCLNRFITLRGVQMILEKIKIQKYFKITKGTKNVRNPKILRTLHIFHFFELFKNFWDFKWLGYCLDRIITLRGCSMGAKKNKNIKILKNYQRYKECEESSHSSYPPHTLLLWTLKNKLRLHMTWILFR